MAASAADRRATHCARKGARLVSVDPWVWKSALILLVLFALVAALFYLVTRDEAQL